jgi:hypothetical protein
MLLFWLFVVACVIVVFVLRHALLLPHRFGETASNRMKQFTVMLVLHTLGWFAWRKTRKLDTLKTMNALCAAIAGTPGGDKIGLRRQMTWDEWIQLPITTHADYAPLIQRMLDGESDCMTKRPLKMFGTTSGTSGEIKIIPMTRYQAWLFFFHGVCAFFYTLHCSIPCSWSLQKSCKLMWEPVFRKSHTGLLIGPNSSAPSNSSAAMVMYSSPAIVYQVDDRSASLFLHALFAMSDENLGMLEGNFASMLHEFVMVIIDRFDELCNAIEMGTIPSSIVVDVDVKDGLQKKMAKNGTRAASLREARTGGLAGLVQRMW